MNDVTFFFYYVTLLLVIGHIFVLLKFIHKARLLWVFILNKMKNIVTLIKEHPYFKHYFGHDKLKFELIVISKPEIRTIRLKFFLTMALLVAISFKGFVQNKQDVPKIALQQATVFTGQVVGWTNNDDYIYDGFYLQTNNNKFLVKFPTNKGNKFILAIKSDSLTRVRGIEGLTPLGEKEIKLVGLKAVDENSNDSLFFSKAIHQVEEFIEDSSKISELQKDNNGKVNAFILDNKIILCMPAHVAQDLNLVALVGTNICYTGTKKGLQNGEVAAVNYTIIHCNTITIDKIQYVIK